MTMGIGVRKLAHGTAGALAASLLLLGTADVASAQTYPSKPITAIVPFGTGNANDVVGRIVLDQVSKQVGQPFIIENRPGAGGTTGVAAVARAAPDGYTILWHSSSFAAAASLYKSLPYDTFNDFAPVGPAGQQPTVLVAAPSKGWKTVADLVAAAKANPGKLNYASAGIGAASHLAAERFRVSAGFSAQHVPFRSPGEALTEVMTGRIDFYFLPVAAAFSFIKQGQVVPLAVSTEKRAASLPDVPTTAEAGLKDASYVFWTGMFVPAKTPPDIVKKLHDEMDKAMAVPSVQEKLEKTGVEPMKMTSEEFGKFFRADVTATAKLAEQAGIPKLE
jgi:tripartite-type tricarboxylate transporter receptor subunit TctC